MPIKVVIADDEALVLEGFAALLQPHPGFELCSQVNNSTEVISKVKMHQPHILLLDLKMDGISGFDILEKLQQQKEKVKVIVLSGHSAPENICRCLELDARAFLNKMVPGRELYKAIEEVHANGSYITDSVRHCMIEKVKRMKKFVPCFDAGTIRFDANELLVLDAFARGLTVEETAKKHNMSGGTVEGLRRGMIDKIKADSFMNVLIYAHQTGQIDLDQVEVKRREE